MSTSRRNFLKSGTMLALAAGVPAAVVEKVTAAEANPTTSAGFDLTKAAFEAHLNTEFRIQVNSKSKVAVKLTDVEDLGSRSRGREAFSLMFRGDSSQPLVQDTYIIEHEHLGLFSFLIVPMRAEKKFQRYEAVVNRLHV